MMWTQYILRERKKEREWERDIRERNREKESDRKHLQQLTKHDRLTSIHVCIKCTTKILVYI